MSFALLDYFTASLPAFSGLEWVAVCFIFYWSGFVRSSLSFGGAVLALPFLLLIDTRLTFWLPVLGVHLLTFSSWVLLHEFRAVDWRVLRQSMVWIGPAKVVGVLGLLSLPVTLLAFIAYSMTLIFGVYWLWGKTLRSYGVWQERLMLFFGGYLSGIMISGAPLIVTVFTERVAWGRLRATLFMLWFTLVLFKLASFMAFDVPLNLALMLVLFPFTFFGSYCGGFLHKKMMKDKMQARQLIGGGLFLVSVVGLIKLATDL